MTKKKTDHRIAMLAGALKRKTPPKVASPKPAPAAAPGAASHAKAKYEQKVIRVSEELITHANLLATELQEKAQHATGNMRLSVAPNQILLIALLRWDTVTPKDHDGIVARGRETVDKTHAMWLPVTESLQIRIQKLQKQFVQRGVLIAKTGANEPAVARQALWRWTEITSPDVAFYLKTLDAEDSAGKA